MNRRHQCGPPRDEIQFLEDHVRRFHRDTAGSASDVDALVAFDCPATTEPCDQSCAPTSNRSESMYDASQREWWFYCHEIIEIEAQP